MSDPQGYLAVVLHAHLPYVRHPEHDDFLEERWFFEAMTETYLPLLRVLEGLEDDGVAYRLLLSLSPTLVAMMEDPLLRERYRRHLGRLLELTDRELDRTRGDGRLHQLARWYRTFVRDSIHWFDDRCDGRIALAFARLASLGRLELMTSAATHGFLPLLREDPGAVRAQVLTGCDAFAATFGVRPTGMWLPECAYYPGLEDVLREAGLRFFLLDTHGIEHAEARPPHGVYAPVCTPAGVAAFARDPESSKAVWSAEEGYPGHPLYREFYRDLGFEASEEHLGPLLVDGRIRVDTGIKYNRITGAEEKDLYDPHAAREQARTHAADFLHRRREQIDRLAGGMDRPPIAVAPYDAELFGHWWFEGPWFLDALFRQREAIAPGLAPETPAGYLQRHPTNVAATPSASSWGADGHYEFWIGDENKWIYPLLHDAARRFRPVLIRTLDAPADSLPGRALRQAGRELLLAQGSDWPFILRTGTSPSYATERMRTHLDRFERLLTMLAEDSVDERTLAALEELDRIFPDLDPARFLDPVSATSGRDD